MEVNSLLAEKINERAKRRRLTVSMAKMRYAHNLFFKHFKGQKFPNALYVGVGHGHFALLSLLDEIADNIVGVDPYYDKDGNSEYEYEELISTINELKLEKRFKVVKSTVEEYLESVINERFDLIVLSDVLHHIYDSRVLLTESSSWHECIKLFSKLKDNSEPGAVMTIHELQRHGLRPWLARIGIINSNINYDKKQNERQWIKAAKQGGWKLDRIDTYIPHSCRNWGWLFNNWLGRYTLSNRYTIYFKNKG